MLSGRVASSLVGVEHAFLLVAAALSGVLLAVTVLEMVEPGLTARGPRGRALRRGAESETEGLAFSLVEGSTRGLTAYRQKIRSLYKSGFIINHLSGTS